MPLSDHEQKLLEQIEQALYAEDPKFAASVRKVKSRRPRGRRWIAWSILGVIVGLGLVLVGLLAKLIILGIVGFVLIVAACAYGAHCLRRGSTSGSTNPGSPSTKNRDAGGLRGRMGRPSPSSLRRELSSPLRSSRRQAPVRSGNRCAARRWCAPPSATATPAIAASATDPPAPPP